MRHLRSRPVTALCQGHQNLRPCRLPLSAVPPTTSSPIRSFSLLSLFGRGDSSSLDRSSSLASAHSAWIQALQTGRLPEIKHAYKSLINWTSNGSSQGTSSSAALPAESDILRMLEIAVNAPNPDIPFIRTVLSHVSRTLTRPFSSEFYRALSKALAVSGDGSKALSSLADAVQHRVEVDATAWEPVAVLYARLKDRNGLETTLGHVKASGLSPTALTYRLMLDLAFNDIPDQKPESDQCLTDMIADLETYGYLDHPIIISGLLDGYLQLGKLDEAKKWANRIHGILHARSDWSKPDHDEIKMIDAFITFLARSSGEAGVFGALKRLRARGFVASSSAITAILRGKGPNADVQSLLSLQDCLGLTADAEAWSILIARALADSGLPLAVTIYDKATTFLKPTVELSKPLFQNRCFTLPNGRNLYDIYQEIVSAEGTAMNASPESVTSMRSLYEDLLLAMASQRDRLLVPKQLSLLVDMRNRSIAFDSTTTGSVLRNLMESSGSYNAAYNIYSTIRNLGPGFAQEIYQVALETFTNLRTDRRASGNFPPSRLFFTIVKDMNDNGFGSEAGTFNMLFTRYRQAAFRVRYDDLGPADNPNRELLTEVKQAHVLFRLYAAITPDTTFLNLLMDTYSRIGGLKEAWSIWQEDLVPPRIYDDKSLSIILDTCGHYGATREAFAVWKTVKEWEGRGSQNIIKYKVWETWIECLCRLDLVDEVRRNLMHELGTPQTRAASDVPPWRTYVTERMVYIAVNFKWRNPGSEAKRALVYATAKHLLPNPAQCI